MPLFQAIRDYLSPPVLGASFVSLLVPLILLGLAVGLGGSHLWEVLQALDAGEPLVSGTIPNWLEVILAYSFVQWIAITLFYLLGGVLALLVSVIIAVVVIGFFTPWLVKFVQKRHYANSRLSGGLSTAIVVKEAVGIFGKFLGLLALSLVLLALPLVNIIALHVPFFYLFYRILMLDVGSVMLDFEAYETFKKTHQKPTILASVVCFILSLIPFVGLFLQPLFVLYFAHYVFQKVLLEAK
jgi:hypothetical protein